MISVGHPIHVTSPGDSIRIHQGQFKWTVLKVFIYWCVIWSICAKLGLSLKYSHVWNGS